MNKEYKAVAEIIKMRKENFSVCDKPKFNGDSYIMACEEIAKDLVKYLEEESDCKCGHTKRQHSIIMFKFCVIKGCNCGQYKPLFDKKQFLKDCGVENNV